MSRSEMDQLGWDCIDILLVSGDAYVDHPAFGTALIGRWLAAHGYRVGIVTQPRWDDPSDVLRLGRPRLFAGVSAGALDSMLSHYTAFRKKRSEDAYTPGGRAGARPNRAAIVYANLVRRAFPELPVILGGMEASMRRVTHYDFWSDSLRASVLLDSKADLLVYGMAEQPVLEAARRLAAHPGDAKGRDTRAARKRLRGIPGAAWIENEGDAESDRPKVVTLPSHEDIQADPRCLMEATLALEQLTHRGDTFLIQHTGKRTTVLAPPPPPMERAALDALYALPFSRRQHPSYPEAVPALETVQFSVTTHRGCGGGCSFCSLALHQGRRIQSRSEASILAEVGRMAAHPRWKGSISDVGGPSANMWGASCRGNAHTCRRESCLWPEICPHFTADQRSIVRLLRSVAAQPGVRHVRTASGVRYDLAMTEDAYVQTLISDFAGGQLKIAPEHCAPHVLRLMRKPDVRVFERFLATFQAVSRKAGREQYVIPYLISAFPGCTDADMRALAAWLKRRHWRPQQVQCFIPTPGTVATAMYFCGTDANGESIHVPRTDAERLRQHGILAAGSHKA